MIYGGIDWADQSFQICFIDEEGQIQQELSIRKTRKGFGELLERARCYQEIEFAIETRHSSLVDFLLSHGYQVYWLNPNRVSSFRGRYKKLRGDRASLPLIKPKPEKVELLELLWRDLEVLLKEQARLKNRLSLIALRTLSAQQL